jgi:hypothetical protein
MATRLKVLNVNLTEETKDKTFHLVPGQVFVHPDDARAKKLLGIRPSIVEETDELTPEEAVKESAIKKRAEELALEKFRKEAEEEAKKEAEDRAKAKAELEKTKVDDLKKIAKEKGLEVPDGANKEAIIEIILGAK